MSRPWHRWTPEEEALLGKAADRAVAEKLGLTVDLVGRRRRAMRIPAYVAASWSEQELSALGTDTDKAVAERIGRSFPAVQQMRVRLQIPAFTKTRDAISSPLNHTDDQVMTSVDLCKWQARMGYTQQQASDALGISRATYNRYLVAGAGKIVALACAAVEQGLRTADT